LTVPLGKSVLPSCTNNDGPGTEPPTYVKRRER
jgi:hypothetical protein